MAFEAIKAEIALLLTQMENQPQDLHELHIMLMEKFRELRALGLPLPQDLLKLEARLAADFPEGRPSAEEN